MQRRRRNENSPVEGACERKSGRWCRDWEAQTEIKKQKMREREWKKGRVRTKRPSPSYGIGDKGRNYIEPRERKKGGEQERAVWLIETESTDRKSLSCHWAERQSLFILLSTTLCSSALSPVSSLRHLPASFTHSRPHGCNSFQTGCLFSERASVFIRHPLGGMSFGMAALECGMTHLCFHCTKTKNNVFH